MPELKIRLLGNFQLTYGDTPRSEFTKAINQPRLQALDVIRNKEIRLTT